MCLDRTLVHAGNAAIVYSIGVSDDVRFEAAVMSSLGIHQVYAFDHTIESPPPLPPGVQGQLHFERVGLGAVEGGQNTTTLGALMRTRGHSRVHLLARVQIATLLIDSMEEYMREGVFRPANGWDE